MTPGAARAAPFDSSAGLLATAPKRTGEIFMTITTDDAATTSRVRALNDQLRKTCVGGAVVCTQGFSALPDATKRKFMFAMRDFDAFTEENDPHGEHDFGAVEVDGQKLFFKIDYFDRAMALHSPDPADPSVTTRVLTIMLADEY